MEAASGSAVTPPTQRMERWLLVAALAPVLLALAAQSVGAGLTEREMARSGLVTQVANVSRLATSLVAAPLEFDDQASLNEVLRSVGRVRDFEYVLVLRADGAAAGYLGDESKRAARIGLALEGPSGATEPGTTQLKSQVQQNGITVGSLIVALNTASANETMERHFLIGGTISLVAGVVAVAVVLALVRTIRRRSERIDRDRAVLKRTGALARVGGWEVTVPDGTLRTSDEASVVLAGTGFSQEDLQQRANTQPEVVQCIEGGTPFDIEVQLDGVHGTRWIRVQGEAERKDGVTQRVFGALQDVTDQRNAREQALAASKSKSQFLANTSHEMRTPLNGILGMTALALETELTAEQRSYLEAVQLSGQNMLATVNDLLDVSRIESGKVTLESVPLQLDQLVVEATRALSSQAQAKDVQLIASLSPTLELRRLGDPLRLSQIMNNLVSNAVKFTPQGEVEVSLSEGNSSDEVLLQVRDTGIGIPLERQEAIFDAFTQSDGSTSRRYGGSGLGLTITRELTKLMGGTIAISSQPGLGTTFHVRLSLPQATHLRSVATAPVQRALVVEPSAAAARAAKAALERLGVPEVTLASSVAAARAVSNRPDVVLLDASFSRDASVFDAPVVVLVPFGYAGAVEPGLKTVSKPLLAAEVQAVLGRSRPSSIMVAPPMPSSPARPLRVLLAEDNAVNATVARRLVEKAGHQVTHVWNGAEALRALEKESYDLVLMDVQMPELDGLEATRRLRVREQTTHTHQLVVAMTANAMKSDELACQEAGMDAFLTKPVDVKKLRELLERMGDARAASGGS